MYYIISKNCAFLLSNNLYHFCVFVLFSQYRQYGVLKRISFLSFHDSKWTDCKL